DLGALNINLDQIWSFSVLLAADRIESDDCDTPFDSISAASLCFLVNRRTDEIVMHVNRCPSILVSGGGPQNRYIVDFVGNLVKRVSVLGQSFNHQKPRGGENCRAPGSHLA